MCSKNNYSIGLLGNRRSLSSTRNIPRPVVSSSARWKLLPTRWIALVWLPLERYFKTGCLPWYLPQQPGKRQCGLVFIFRWVHLIFFAASPKLESSGKSWKVRNVLFAFRTAWISPTTAPSVRLRSCKRIFCHIISFTLKKEPQVLSSQALWFSEFEPGPSLYSWQRWVNAQSMEDSGAQNFGQQRGNVTFRWVVLIRYLTEYLMKRWKMCTTKQATTLPCLTTSRTYQAPKGQNTMTT